jgi:hypothetical protein
MNWVAKISHILALVGICALLWMPYRLKFLRWLLRGETVPEKEILAERLGGDRFHTSAVK